MPANKKYSAKYLFWTLAHISFEIKPDEKLISKYFENYFPGMQSFGLTAEKHKPNKEGVTLWHLHGYCEFQKKWQWRRDRWSGVFKKFQTEAIDFKWWTKKTGLTVKEWRIEKYGYTQGDSGKLDSDKLPIWIYSSGVRYNDLKFVLTPPDTGVDTKSPAYKVSSTVSAEGQILEKFDGGESLLMQWENASWAMKAKICMNRDKLTSMITNHKKFKNELKRSKPKFTKDNFILTTAAEVTDFSKKCLVLQGGSNLGKTQYAKSFFKKPLLVRHMDKLKQFDELTHDGIVFDDCSFAHYPREAVISLMDVEEEADINVKNSMVTIPPGTPRIFTTNRVMRHIDTYGAFDKDRSFLPARLHDDDTAIDRRVNVVPIEQDIRKFLDPPDPGSTNKKRKLESV